MLRATAIFVRAVLPIFRATCGGTAVYRKSPLDHACRFQPPNLTPWAGPQEQVRALRGGCDGGALCSPVCSGPQQLPGRR